MQLLQQCFPHRQIQVGGAGQGGPVPRNLRGLPAEARLWQAGSRNGTSVLDVHGIARAAWAEPPLSRTGGPPGREALAGQQQSISKAEAEQQQQSREVSAEQQSRAAA
jgi:hypothetical protein